MSISPVLNFYAPAQSRRWVKAIQDSGPDAEVWAFSPFITNCAVTAALAEKGSNCHLYTVITVENYTIGGSKLPCLRRLVSAGVKVHHLERLHAKILLLRAQAYVTLGSQNMTEGGTKNLEATVVLSGKKATAKTWKQVEPWTKVAKLVTDEDVDYLEVEVKKLAGQQRELRKKAKASTAELWDRWQDREEERKRHHAYLNRLPTFRRRGVVRYPVPKYAREIVAGRLVEHARGWSLSNLGENRGETPSYCKWFVGEEEIELTRFRWYHCYHLDTFRWGRARATETRISFVDPGYTHMRRLDVGTNRHVYAVEYDKDDEHQGCNIKMNVRIAGVDARFWGFYDLTELTLSKIDAGARDDEQDQFDTVAFQEFMRDINENVNDIQRAILDELHMHSRRRGLWSYYRAEQFFENTNAPIYTALQVLGDHKVLLFSSDKQKLKSEMARRLSELGA